MSRISEGRVARRKLEIAIANLIEHAIKYEGAHEAWKTRELLEHAREYGRAFNRVEAFRK